MTTNQPESIGDRLDRLETIFADMGSQIYNSFPISFGSTTMQSIKLRSHVGLDGVLHLDIPVEMTDTEIEVTVIIQRVTPEQRGSMPGFFEEVIGGWVGEPLQRLEQGEYETREQIF